MGTNPQTFPLGSTSDIPGEVDMTQTGTLDRQDLGDAAEVASAGAEKNLEEKLRLPTLQKLYREATETEVDPSWDEDAIMKSLAKNDVDSEAVAKALVAAVANWKKDLLPAETEGYVDAPECRALIPRSPGLAGGLAESLWKDMGCRIADVVIGATRDHYNQQFAEIRMAVDKLNASVCEMKAGVNDVNKHLDNVLVKLDKRQEAELSADSRALLTDANAHLSSGASVVGTMNTQMNRIIDSVTQLQNVVRGIQGGEPVPAVPVPIPGKIDLPDGVSGGESDKDIYSMTTGQFWQYLVDHGQKIGGLSFSKLDGARKKKDKVSFLTIAAEKEVQLE